jgi:hypothetical protein
MVITAVGYLPMSQILCKVFRECQQGKKLMRIKRVFFSSANFAENFRSNRSLKNGFKISETPFSAL